MDWKLDQQRREKKQAMAKNEPAHDVDIAKEMEREFEQIFGGVKSGFYCNRGKAGDPVRRNEYKPQKSD